jgi:hypothetical protein
MVVCLKKKKDRTNKKKTVKVEKFPDPIVRLPSTHRHRGQCKINFMWDWKKEITRAVADLNRKQTLVSYFVISN